MTPRTARRPPLVERQHELDRLSAALDGAADGRPSVTVVAGEAGIGKTRLLRALEDIARERGLLVLHGDCMRLGELPVAALDAALRDVSADVLERLPSAARGELGLAFPHLPVEPRADPAAAPHDQHAQRRLYDSLICLLTELGHEAPVLLAIEDFHWADWSTRQFVAFLARVMRRERLAVVLSHRTEPGAPPSDGLTSDEVVADLARLECPRLELRPLTPAGIDELAHAVLGTACPADLVAQVIRRSGGIPLLANELLAAFLGGHGARLPAGVENRVLQQLRRVSPGARHVIGIAAVARRPVNWDFLIATSGLPEIELNRALREALDQLLLDEDAGQLAYTFRHEVVREAVYSRALHEGERRTVHAVIAGHLSLADPTAYADLAFHWRAAGRGEEALTAALQAGFEAERAQVYGAAAEAFKSAAELWDERDGGPPEAPVDRIGLAEHLSDAYKHAGDKDSYEKAKQACHDALGRLDTADDAERASALYARLGSLNSSHSEIALECFTTALALLPAGDRGRRARLIAEQACALIGLERSGDAVERAAEALDLATEANAKPEVLYARTVLGLALVLEGRPKQGEESLTVALEAAGEHADPDDLLRGYLYLGEARRLCGRFDAARAAMERGSELARRLGMQDTFGWYFDANAAGDLFHLARFSEADTVLEAVREHPLESWAETLLRQVSGQLALARGALGDAETELRLGLARCDEAQPESSAPIYATLAEAALWRQSTDEARGYIQAGFAAMEAVRELLYTPALHATGARVEADAAARAMDQRQPQVAHRAHAAAAALAADLDARRIEQAGRQEPPTAAAYAACCAAEVLRAAAELSRIQAGGRSSAWEEAAAGWAAAAARWDRLEGPYPAAYALLRRAEALLSAHGRTRAGIDAVRVAHAEAQRIGAPVLRSAVEALARRARVDPAPRSAPAPRPVLPLGLTAREQQTLTLLARGMTNREIAAELVISTRTVDVHVSRILGKLGVGNRTEAVAAAHRLGLTEDAPTIT